MTSRPLQVQRERDPKNAQRFYLTIAESQVAPFAMRQTDLHIQTAEKLLAEVKKLLAKRGAETIIAASPKLKNVLPSGSHGDCKPYSVKRAPAGTVPTHFRVGLQVTFSDPADAQIFAKVVGIS